MYNLVNNWSIQLNIFIICITEAKECVSIAAASTIKLELSENSGFLGKQQTGRVVG